MGRVKIKHPRPKEITTRRELLGILAPSVRVARLIPTWDGVAVVTASDKDTDTIFKDEVLKALLEGGFNPLLPPELKAQRTVLCFQLDELICEHTAEGIQEEIERSNGWAKVAEVYKFPRSSTVKITFRSSEMSKKATDNGILMFSMSVPPHQIRQEVYIPILSCNRCYAVETHATSQCPHPNTYKRCSECASSDHTFRDCQAREKKCINCDGPHSARAMRCPVRKEALREKEEEQRRNRTQPNFSYSQAAQAPPTQNVAGHNLTGLMCVLHAHLVNSARPGSFQATLNESLRLNGLPEVRLPPHPPSSDILRAITGASDLAQMTSAATTSPATDTTENHRSEHQEDTNENDEPPTLQVKDSEGKHPKAVEEEEEDEEDEERIEVSVYKRASDSWPKALTYSHLKSGLREGRYKFGHSGGEEDTPNVQEWLRRYKGSLQHHCQSVPDDVFSALKNGPIPRKTSQRRTNKTSHTQ